MNPDLDKLQPYPFERLAALLADSTPPADQNMISLAIGEPRHPVPAVIAEALQGSLDAIASYPATRGSDALRHAVATWLQQRFAPVTVDPGTQVLPVNGTREALFAVCQALVDRRRDALVGMPNPGYQIYEGAALLAGAQPWYLPCLPENNYLPDFTGVQESVWQRIQLMYVCSPGNPTGAVVPLEELQRLIELAERHDFVIASDECYSEIYPDEQNPPPGLLQAAAAMGNDALKRCLVFHSLSKRSNVPGLRSGFVAGDADLIAQFLRYRTYHGCAMSPAVQQASIAAWSDEAHVHQNRDLYREKFSAVLEVLQPALDVSAPDASFYLWPRLSGGDDETTACRLWQEAHIRCLPGRYLGREIDGLNPGANHLRLSLVPSVADCIDAAQRMLNILQN